MSKVDKVCKMTKCIFYDKITTFCPECARNYCPECPARNSCRDESIECVYEDYFQYESISGAKKVKHTYKVLISKQYVHSATVELEAYTKQDAKKMALELMGETSLVTDEGVEGSEEVIILN